MNGFGRIGRLVFRQILEEGQIAGELAAVNDIAPLDNLVYLLNKDSVQASPQIPFGIDGEHITWQDRKIRFLNERAPADLPWAEMDVDLVIEASGVFTERDKAARHLDAGAEYVIISAPAKNADLTLCLGVNQDQLDLEKHKVISNASCTTNCLAPVAKVLDEEFGIEHGLLTTIHAYTSSQALVDAPSKKWRRGRAAAESIVPTTTGAAIATTLVLPQLKGRMDGLAVRVPIPAGSVIDFVAQTRKPVTVERVNQAFQKSAKKEELHGIMGYTEEELVSADIIGSGYSALVDGLSTLVINDQAVKVLAWYDNEWGYAQRVTDLAGLIHQLIR